ncbi:MAG: hypothetical protein ACYC19_03285 [Acidimicrobiales bacterium]
MTQPTDVLGQLRTEWNRAGRSSEAQRSLLALIDHSPELALESLGDLCDLVHILERGGGRSVLERAAVVQALLECASDQLIARTLLQTMLPGVVSVCRQLRFGEGIIRDPSETLSMALGLASELIADWAGQSRQYAAPDFLSALRGRLRRWLLKEKAALCALSYFEQGDEAATEESPLLTRLGSFRGSQYERIARLTYERVFEGRSLVELAASDHSAAGSLRAELQHFAVRHLL